MVARQPRRDARNLVMGPGRKIPRSPASRPQRPDPPPDAGETAPDVAKAAGELLALAAQIRECKVCGVGSFVLGTGSPRAPVMLLRDHPSAADLESGGAFTDEADPLTKAFDALGIPAGWIYGTTVVRHQASVPSDDDIAHGCEHVLVEVEAVGPSVIVAFGERAAAALATLDGRCGLAVPDELGPGDPIRVRSDLVVLVTEALPDGVTQRDAKRRLWRDLQAVPKVLET
ncbi:MAG: uracil-DNA glycosylase family protein [Actinomycetota bacterium]